MHFFNLIHRKLTIMSPPRIRAFGLPRIIENTAVTKIQNFLSPQVSRTNDNMPFIRRFPSHWFFNSKTYRLWNWKMDDFSPPPWNRTSVYNEPLVNLLDSQHTNTPLWRYIDHRRPRPRRENGTDSLDIYLLYTNKTGVRASGSIATERESAVSP